MEDQPYNPLDPINLARSVELTLLQQPCHLLPVREAFSGSGLYALYYQGDFAPYRPISAPDGSGPPIYVGEAMASGTRIGVSSLDEPAGPVLYRRLRDHWKSIDAAENLRIEDFRCRYLVCEEIFIMMGEALLITQFRPLWNRWVSGFGIHDPGKGRHGSERSEWDELHPGRPWYSKMVAARTAADIQRKIRQVFVDGQTATVDRLPETAPLTAGAQVLRVPDAT